MIYHISTKGGIAMKIYKGENFGVDINDIIGLLSFGATMFAIGLAIGLAL